MVVPCEECRRERHRRDDRQRYGRSRVHQPDAQGTLLLGLFAMLGAEIRSIKSLIEVINQISETRFHEEDLIGRVYKCALQFLVAGQESNLDTYRLCETTLAICSISCNLDEPYDSGQIQGPFDICSCYYRR